MRSCRLTVLGGFAFATGDGTDMPLPTRKDRVLLAYLALADGKPQSRERLAGLLWGDRAETQARDSLRQSLAALRQAFRQTGLDPLQAERDLVVLGLEGIVIDAVVFAHLAAADPAAALPLYAGNLLEGFDGVTPECDAWLAPERERLDALAALALERIAEFSEGPAEDDAAAIRFGRQLLARDRLREPVVRAMMRLLARSGDRAEALKLYGGCRKALQQELGVTPDARTEALYRDILTDRLDKVAVARDVDRASDRPGIAVLPLSNLSGDAALDPLCDGLTEDITTGLGRFRLLFVIDRHSAAAAAEAGDLAEIGRRLNVGFLVQGSLQRRGERVRITVRLVDAATRNQLWGEAVDAPLAEILELPDRVTGAIVATLHGRVEHSVMDQTRRKPKLAAYECLLRGIKYLRGYGPDDNERAVALFGQAVELDPDYHMAQVYLTFGRVIAHGYGRASEDMWQAALAAGHAAVEANGDDSHCHWLLGAMYGHRGDIEHEARHYQRAVELNPNDANAVACIGISLATQGKPDEGIERIRTAMRLNPYHPEWYWDDLGVVFYLAGRYADAIEAFNRRAQKGTYVLPRLAAALAQLGRMDEAAAAVAELRTQQPAFSMAKLDLDNWGPDNAAHFRDGMRKAGLPE